MQISKAYLMIVKLEVEGLAKLRFLEKINDSERVAGAFIIPRRDKALRFLTDLRELDKIV